MTGDRGTAAKSNTTAESCVYPHVKGLGAGRASAVFVGIVPSYISRSAARRQIDMKRKFLSMHRSRARAPDWRQPPLSASCPATSAAAWPGRTTMRASQSSPSCSCSSSTSRYCSIFELAQVLWVFLCSYSPYPVYHNEGVAIFALRLEFLFYVKASLRTKSEALNALPQRLEYQPSSFTRLRAKGWGTGGS